MTDGLKNKYRRTIIEIIAQNPRIRQTVLFGSRATDAFTATLDVDIAIFGEELTLTDQAKLMAEIERLPMPQRADVLIYENVSNEKLRESIRRYGVTLYEKQQEPE